MAEAVRSGSFCSSVKEELMGNNRNIKSNDILVNITCTIVFVVFTFVYLYCYQADLLTAMQHVFSKGQTHYNHLIGASLITFILLLVQRGVSRLCQGVRVANSLTYVPSALLLTFLTSAHPYVRRLLVWRLGDCLAGIAGGVCWFCDIFVQERTVRSPFGYCSHSI